MPDRLFSDPRLAAIYDDIDGDRSDLDHYEALISEFGISEFGPDDLGVVDVGCGTGALACRLAEQGITVTGIDPARASLDVARAKPHAERVTWLEGVATDLPALGADVATMTGNVAQVFVDDDDWSSTLGGINRALRPGGHLIFETRDPEVRAWEAWGQRLSSRRSTSAGPIEYGFEVTAVELPLVSFRVTYSFERTGETLTSDSTLRFRGRDEIEESLLAAGFDVVDLRDAPDRPGREFVFVARTRVD